jgi:1-Cys peroxiredoxin 6
MLVLFF